MKFTSKPSLMNILSNKMVYLLYRHLEYNKIKYFHVAKLLQFGLKNMKINIYVFF